jgi:putative transposase
VDLGVKDFAVTSDEQRIPNPKHLERRARNLARYQRRTARCQPGSANRGKARAKAARAHRKVRAARADFLHKTSTRLVRDHDLICLEDLAVKNMVKNRKVAKAISDCGWRTFRQMLEYKAARYGRRVIVIDRWFPSSKMCSACGHVLAELGLKIRTWQCPSCGTRHDRDNNAASSQEHAVHAFVEHVLHGARRSLASSSPPEPPAAWPPRRPARHRGDDHRGPAGRADPGRDDHAVPAQQR